jgi:hypothetical protein
MPPRDSSKVDRCSFSVFLKALWTFDGGGCNLQNVLATTSLVCEVYSSSLHVFRISSDVSYFLGLLH